MKKIFNFAFFASILLIPSLAVSEPGVVIEAKGSVKVVQGNSAATAKSGTQFGNGAVIKVDKGASATIMFASGATKKLRSGEKFAVANAGSTKSNSSMIKGLAMAYNDAASKTRGPVVHGMVKASPGSNLAVANEKTENRPIPPDTRKMLAGDLRQVESMGITGDGLALMNAQVYYKYGQYRTMVETLLPVYKTQNPPSDMVKKLLILGYEKMGRREEANKLR